MITSHSSEVVDNLAASLFKYSIIVDVVFLAFSLLDDADPKNNTRYSTRIK